MTTPTTPPWKKWVGTPRPKPAGAPVRLGPITPAHRSDPAMEAFRSYGLGQFFHFGVYSIPGNEWEGVSARGGALASEWIRQWSGPSAPENWQQTYDGLYRTFDPVEFDAARLARQARAMGARYVIFPTKHHDGFALWPTEFSEYSVARTPYGGDIVGEVVSAYTAEGIDVFLYFSILEWAHPDYLAEPPRTPEEEARWRRYLEYTRAQLLELLERYPEVKGFWFDGTWDTSWVASAEYTHRLERELREHRPGLIIGSRFRNDEYGSRHFDSDGRLLGDYEQIWERKLPPDHATLEGHDWDCVMSITPNGWGYMKDVSGLYLKTPDDIIELLMRCRSMNGNLVVNFGPDARGRTRPEEDEIARVVGAWIAENAEAVYDSRHAEVPAVPYGHYTRTARHLYLTVVNRPVTGILRLPFPTDAVEVPIDACILATGRALAVTRSDIGFDLDENTYYDVALPADLTATRAFVVKMTLGAPGTPVEVPGDARM